MTDTFTIDPQLRLFAAALNGDEAAIQTLANSPELEPLIVMNRLAPTLAIHATNFGFEGPQVDTWMQHMRHNAVLRMRLEAARREIGEVLAENEIPWTPLKGMGLDPRIHPRPEARIATDLDVLVQPEHALSARDQIISRGWRSTEITDRRRRYVTEEGYNWHLGFTGGLSLELHFRLWGGVSEQLAAEVFDRAQPAPEFGTTARRIDLADSYLIAAVHVWQTPPPRYLALWWDLHRMASIMEDGDVQVVATRAAHHGLHAFVALSAATAADLWGHPEQPRDRNRPRAKPPPHRTLGRLSPAKLVPSNRLAGHPHPRPPPRQPPQPLRLASHPPPDLGPPRNRRGSHPGHLVLAQTPPHPRRKKTPPHQKIDKRAKASKIQPVNFKQSTENFCAIQVPRPLRCNL